ncbi:MAG: glycosyl hydrolase family 18 protein [Syntrophothermus sp.]
MKIKNTAKTAKRWTSLFAAVLLLSGITTGQKKIAAFYAPQLVKSVLPASAVQYNNLTHLMHAFVYTNRTGALKIDAGVLYPELVTETHKAGKKIMVAFGGADDSGTLSADIAFVAADSALRSTLVKNLTDFILSNGYDGIDMDWEFPSDAVQGQNLTKLVKELRESFTARSSGLLIAVDVTPTDWFGRHLEYSKLVNYVDWFNLMAYNFHGSWIKPLHSGHNAPLYSPSTDVDGCVNDGVNYLLKTRGVPKDKIVVGVAYYGFEYNSAGIYQSATGSVPTILYTDIASRMNSGLWDYKWDDYSKVPYIQDKARTKLVSFDDTTSLRIKSEYVFQNQLGGVMIWALGEDLTGGKQPLNEAIGNSFRRQQTSVNDAVVKLDYRLYNNYPNPFNPSTVIRFSLPAAASVKLQVFNALGEVAAELINGEMNAGLHEYTFNAEGMASGIYFCRLTAGSFINTKKMILAK